MTTNANQLAGAMLEEAVLSVLGAAGFRPLETLQGDATIDPAGPPVTIRGRGTAHQIDAVADPLVGYAFSNPARLLVEAKAYSEQRRVANVKRKQDHRDGVKQDHLGMQWTLDS